MPVEAAISAGTPIAFLLVLARVSGAMIFVPLPGATGTPTPARIVLALGFTLALASRWPAVDAATVTLGKLVAWAVAEAAIGILIGVVVSVVLESLAFAAQVLSLPAGYGYASVLDPATQADSGILVVLAQLMAGLLFFALGLDRQVLKLFALSLERIPAGAYVFGPRAAEAVVRIAGGLFAVGLRMALPIVALLMLVDVALGLVGRLNSQLQLLSLAFPAKMLAALMMLVWLAALYPRILLQFAGQAFGATQKLLGL
jgi:flagellar biosynthetic protein FliR